MFHLQVSNLTSSCFLDCDWLFLLTLLHGSGYVQLVSTDHFLLGYIFYLLCLLFQYSVVELVVDVPNSEGETEVEKYACAASTNWLFDVKRIEDGDGHVKYVAEKCLWPKNEAKLSQCLERRSKPGDDWVLYPFTVILKFCRKFTTYYPLFTHSYFMLNLCW